MTTDLQASRAPDAEVLRLLVVGDSDAEAERLAAAAGHVRPRVSARRAGTRDDLERLLLDDWDLVLSDYRMVHLDCVEALVIVQEARPAIPFIVVAGGIGEEAAAELIRHGARDYVSHDHLERLPGVILRELDQVPSRAAEVHPVSGCRSICRSLVRQSPDGLIIVDSSGTIVEFNPRMEQISGLSSGEVLGKFFWEIPFSLSPDGRLGGGPAEALGRLTEVLLRLTQEPVPGEPPYLEIARPDGTVRTVQATLFPIVTPEGTHLGSTMRDVTARKQAEEASARVKDQIYHQLVETSSEGILIFDLGGQIRFANHLVAGLLGLSADDLISRPFLDLVAPEYRESCGSLVERIKSGDCQRLDSELIRADGSRLSVVLSMSPLRDSRGETLSIFAFAEDVTGRKIADSRLRESEARLSLLTNSITTGLLIVQDLRIRYANAALERITGYSRKEITAMSLDDLIQITDRVSQKYLRTIKQSNPEAADISNLEIGIRRKAGSEGWCQLTVSPMEYDGRPATLITVFDVTERHEAECALRDNEEKFHVLSEMITAAIVIVQHGRIIYANYAAEHIIGYSREELMAMSKLEWTSILDARSCQFLRSVDMDQLAQLEELPRLETRFTRKDGTERWGEITLGIMEYGGQPAALATVFDLTEHKATEDALRENESKFREIFHKSNDAIFLLEADSPSSPMRIIEVNAVACRWTGLGHDELLLTETMDRLLSLESQTDAARKLAELHQTGYALFNCAIKHRDGTSIEAELSAHLFTIGPRKLIHCTARDITERKRAQKALESNLRFLQTLIDDIPAPVFYKDLREVYLGCNTAYARFLGVPREGIIGRTVFDLYPQDLACEYHDADLRILRGLVIDSQESKYVSSDGRVRQIITYKAPLIDETGQVTGIVGTILDISERKRYEHAVRENEEKFRSVVEQSSDGIVIVNEYGGIIEFNCALERISGICREDARKMALWDMFFSMLPREARVPAAYGELKASIQGLLTDSGITDPIVSPYMDIDSPDGSVKTIQAVIFPIKISKGMLLCSIIRDVTERRLFENTLEKERAELKRSNEELEQFAYVASHDLQEPLRLITSYVKLLEKRYKGKLDADADDYINFTVDGAARMQLIIKDLLLYSRVDRIGKPHEMVSLETVCEKALQNLTLAVQESGATVRQSPLPAVLGDGIQLMQVFQNLISNALKYRSEKPPEIRIAAERQGSDWLISVSDNGIGIDPQYFKKLFTIFQRLHSRAEYPGNGIGLAVCKKIVESHGGRIWVESKPGEGSTFRFTLPAADQRRTGAEDRGVVP